MYKKKQLEHLRRGKEQNIFFDILRVGKIAN